QYDLEVIAALHELHQPGQKCADQQAKHDSKRQRVKLFREEADRDSRDYSFECGTNHDSKELIANSRREPRSQAVNQAEDRAKQYTNQGLRHFHFSFVEAFCCSIKRLPRIL